VVHQAGATDVVTLRQLQLPDGVDVPGPEAGTRVAANSDAAGDMLYAANPTVAATLTATVRTTPLWL